MAITKIIKIKAHPQKAVDYICDKNKTETKENILIDSKGCGIHSVKYDFERIHRNCYKDKDPQKIYTGNLAYHIVQSFVPGEVTPELAHKIGKEYADKILEGKYSYVISTHINKGHIHNHIIFCSTDNFGIGRYNDCTRERYRRERINDEICKEYGLSVIDKSKNHNRGLKYNDWEKQKQKKDWKTEYISDIEQSIKLANSYTEFLELMKNKGYEINDSRKHITFTSKIYGNLIRGGTLKNRNGENYSRENIKNKIANKKDNEKKIDWKAEYISDIEQSIKLVNSYTEFLELMKNKGYEIGNSYKSITFTSKIYGNLIKGEALVNEYGKNYSRENIKEKIANKKENQKYTTNENRKPYIVDINEDKFKNSKGLNRWAYSHNLQAANDILNFAKSLGFTSIKSVYTKISETENNIEKLKNNNENNRDIINNNRILMKYAQDCIQIQNIYNGYRQCKNKEEYFEKHEDAILAYEMAFSHLKAAGFKKGNKETYSVLQEEIDELEGKISLNNEKIKEINKSLKNLRYIKKQWDIYMNKQEKQQNKKTERNKNIDL